MTTEAPKGKLFAALSQAQQRCKAVEKDSQNTFHRYAYASSEALIGEAKKALEGSGLSFLPVVSSLTGETDKVLVRRFMLAHESGESVEVSTSWPVVPDKGRPLDKAVASAATTSLAYLLRDLLLMPRVDESDDMDSPRRDEQPRTRGREAAGATGSRRAARPEAQQDHATAGAGEDRSPPQSPSTSPAPPPSNNMAVLAELRAAASRLTDSQEDLDLTIKSGELGKSILGSLGNRDAWRETGKLDGIAANGRQLRDFLTKLMAKVTA